jgi:hypothetical protein
MNDNIKKVYGVSLLVLASVLFFVLFGILGFNGTVIDVTSSVTLLKLVALFAPSLGVFWVGLVLYANKKTANQLAGFVVAFMIAAIAIAYLRTLL